MEKKLKMVVLGTSGWTFDCCEVGSCFDIVRCRNSAELSGELLRDADVLVFPIAMDGLIGIAAWHCESTRSDQVVVGIQGATDLDPEVFKLFCQQGAEIARDPFVIPRIVNERLARRQASKKIEEESEAFLRELSASAGLAQYLDHWVAVDPKMKGLVIIDPVTATFWGKVHLMYGVHWYTQVFCTRIIQDLISPNCVVKYF